MSFLPPSLWSLAVWIPCVDFLDPAKFIFKNGSHRETEVKLLNTSCLAPRILWPLSQFAWSLADLVPVTTYLPPAATFPVDNWNPALLGYQGV